jgi:hypothetical protein
VVEHNAMPPPNQSSDFSLWIGPIFGLIGVILGVLLNTIGRFFDERLFGPKLVIDCQRAPGQRGETDDMLYVRFRVRNLRKRRLAKQCCAYIVGLYRVTDGRRVSENLLTDSFQLSWAGYAFDPRIIPSGVSQYVNLVQFSKHDPGWRIVPNPASYDVRLDHIKGYQGIYEFEVVVAADGAVITTAYIKVEYRVDWHNVAVYE